ncbi:MAG: 4Fe-4S binding protein [Bacteroidota bacterium]
MEYPKVNQELCAGCAVCIEICPLEAIVIEDDKASIIEKNCGGCRACESMCPVAAIA